MTWEDAVKFCENHECKQCKIRINNLDVRTTFEKCNGHTPCSANLVDKFRIQHGYKPIT